MRDRYNREIDYLRISVTDKCNLRCIYCVPDEDLQCYTSTAISDYEFIEKIVIKAANLGIKKIRLTGGEPLVRKDIELLVSKIAAIEKIKIIALTTNGINLFSKADALKSNGLTHLNISLDTLNKEKYAEITRGGNIDKVLIGIEKARELNFKKIKINMVMIENLITREDEKDLQNFCKKRNIELQRISHYSLNNYTYKDNNFERPLKCSTCNRIRLMADGTFKPCLNSDIEISVDSKDISSSIKKAIMSKPVNGTKCTTRNMVQIGG